MPAREIAVTIGDVALNSVFTPGPTMYLLRNTEEILDSLRTRRTDTPKQGEHGSEGSLSSFEPRILMFRGEIHARTQTERVVMQHNLDKAVSLSRSQSFDGDDGFKLIEITDEDGVEKQLYAKIDVMPEYHLIDEGMPESRRFEFTMFAEDPTVYAQELTAEEVSESYDTTTFTFQDGDLQIFQDDDLPTFQDVNGIAMEFENVGTFASPPLITLSGPLLNPVITNQTSGKSMSFTRNGGVELAEGDTLTINVASHTAIMTSAGVDTNVRTKLSLDTKWFDIVPGVNFVALLDETEGELSGAMEISFRSAWI